MSQPGASLIGRRLLVVEDEAMVAMMLEEMLTELGCVVVDMASSVARGLVLVDSIQSDLDAAVLDINLGGEKVYPLAEKLAHRGVPFIFSTGYAPSSIIPAFQAIPTLTKPYGSSALEASLLAALAGAPSKTQKDRG